MNATTNRRPRWPLYLLLALAAVPAITALRIALADAQARRNPAAALRWWPAQRDAGFRVAQAALDAAPPDPDRARMQAQARLRASPIDGRAYALLGELAERQGDAAKALALFRLAALHAPRNRLAQARLADAAWQERRWDEAVYRFDQLLRTAPELSAGLHPLLAAIAAVPEGRAALAGYLGRQPTPWREGFLRHLANQPDAAPLPLFAALRSTPIALGANERAAWIGRLIRDRDVARAYLLWVDALPPERRGGLGNVYDGGFEQPESQDAFGWRFERSAGATIRRANTSGAAGAYALSVEFHNQRTPFRHVTQRLALPPGDYRLEGRVRADSLHNERGLQWRIQCEGGPRLAETERFSGHFPWRGFSAGFAVPAQGCASQWLQLLLPARIQAEQMASGRLWFDELRILGPQ